VEEEGGLVGVMLVGLDIQIETYSLGFLSAPL